MYCVLIYASYSHCQPLPLYPYSLSPQASHTLTTYCPPSDHSHCLCRVTASRSNSVPLRAKRLPASDVQIFQCRCGPVTFSSTVTYNAQNNTLRVYIRCNCWIPVWWLKLRKILNPYSFKTANSITWVKAASHYFNSLSLFLFFILPEAIMKPDLEMIWEHFKYLTIF